MTPDAYTAGVEAWRADRDARLRRPDGWLTLVGLHWLNPGDNHIGADSSSEVVLQGDGVPAHVGTLQLLGDQVRFVPARGADVRSAGEPAGEMPLADDVSGDPTILEVGSLRFHVIRRGEGVALRVRDTASPALGRFGGLDHFPIDPSWRVIGRLERPEDDATVEIVDITGRVSQEPSPGHVAFERDGGMWRLAALPGDDDGSLWLIFGDATNGGETYGGGRYLYSEPVAADGSVVVDFNLAYNPPCVFSSYATCPLPPPQNRLALRIEAGEKDWHGAALEAH